MGFKLFENRFSITYKYIIIYANVDSIGVSMLQPVLFYLFIITYVPYLFLVIFNLASL